ncbi:hypothetical protein GQ457_08G000860 [Hibiscus cannabinus]
MQLSWEGNKAGAVEINGTDTGILLRNTQEGERETYPKGIKYYRYMASLPALKMLFVFLKLLIADSSVTREQVRLLRNYNTNARPLQPINHPSIQLFRPDDKHKT